MVKYYVVKVLTEHEFSECIFKRKEDMRDYVENEITIATNCASSNINNSNFVFKMNKYTDDKETEYVVTYTDSETSAYNIRIKISETDDPIKFIHDWKNTF